MSVCVKIVIKIEKQNQEIMMGFFVHIAQPYMTIFYILNPTQYLKLTTLLTFVP